MRVAGWPVIVSAIALGVALAGSTLAGGKVGTGTSASCTEAELATALMGGGTVTFDCGPVPAPIAITVQHSLDADTTIDGVGVITLAGNDSTRLFEVSVGATVTLRGLTLTHGYANDNGGAISSLGTLIIDGCTFTDNKTSSSFSGGAIRNLGPLTITNSTFARNVAGNGGALYPRFANAVTTITDSIFTENIANAPATGWGGAMLIWDGAPVRVERGTFTANKARSGGALYVYAGSTLYMYGSLIEGNLGDNAPAGGNFGGGIANAGSLLFVDGEIAANTIAEAFQGGLLDTRGGGGLVNYANATAAVWGGVIRDNGGRSGGGIWNAGRLTLSNVMLTANRAAVGAGLNNVGIADVLGTTFAGNETSADFTSSSFFGGAISNGGELNLVNSTLSGNVALTAGGGIFDTGATITLLNVTIAGNGRLGLATASSPNNTSVIARNTLLAGNATGNCNSFAFRTFVSEFGMSDDNSCMWTGAGNQSGVDVRLQPLAENGGRTQTHLLGAGSPAVDGGTVNECPDTDQRGSLRPQGTSCDVGAVEMPQMVAGCAEEATLDSVLCRLRLLRSTIDGVPEPFAAQEKLLRLLGGASAYVERALQLEPRRSRRPLRRAGKRVKAVRRVAGRRELPADVGAAITTTTPGLLTNLKQLRESAS